MRSIELRQCVECGEVYTTEEPHARYCGPRCGNRVRFRRWYKTKGRDMRAAAARRNKNTQEVGL